MSLFGMYQPRTIQDSAPKLPDTILSYKQCPGETEKLFHPIVLAAAGSGSA